MHCARCPVFPASFLHGGKKDLYLSTSSLHGGRRAYICPPFCGRANKQDHCLILWSVRLLYHTGLLQDFIFEQPRNRKKVLPSQHLLPNIPEKQTSSYSCRGFECRKIHRNLSKKNRKKCCLGNICCQVCQKTNQLKSVQGYGKHKTHKIFVSPKKRKRKKVLPWQHLLPGVAEKLISSSLCRGMESKEPIKIFYKSMKQKKCCHGNTCCQASLEN